MIECRAPLDGSCACSLTMLSDVELNPGLKNIAEREQMANTEKILLDVQIGQTTMLAKLAEIVAKQTELA